MARWTGGRTDRQAVKGNEIDIKNSQSASTLNEKEKFTKRSLFGNKQEQMWHLKTRQ